jgi:hypothetical protein
LITTAQAPPTQDQLKEVHIQGKLMGLAWRKQPPNLNRVSVRHGQISGLKIGIPLLETPAPTKTHKFRVITALPIPKRTRHRTPQKPVARSRYRRTTMLRSKKR